MEEGGKREGRKGGRGKGGREEGGREIIAWCIIINNGSDGSMVDYIDHVNVTRHVMRRYSKTIYNRQKAIGGFLADFEEISIWY